MPSKKPAKERTPMPSLAEREQSFINNAKETHDDVYDYSKVAYAGSKVKVTIICPEHGEFEQIPNSHLKGRGCPSCYGTPKHTVETFVKKSHEVHGEKYDYSKVVYTGNKDKVIINCPIHGEFEQKPNSHMSGQGCPTCANEDSTLTTDEFIERSRKQHGERYDYDKSVYVNSYTKLTITCPLHGDFEQNPCMHSLFGQGCSECGRIASTEKVTDIRQAHIAKDSLRTFASSEQMQREYDEIGAYAMAEKHKVTNGTIYRHLANHDIEIAPSPSVSHAEKAINRVITEEIGLETIQNSRSILGTHEIDIYIPSLKVGIEYNGLRWHSTRYKPDYKYHLNKTKLAESKGIRLIHIFEDEWMEKPDIVIKKLKVLCGVKEDRVYARDTTVRDAWNMEVRVFYNTHHIQGFGSPATQVFVLEEGDDIVAAMSFKKVNGKPRVWDLSRFATSKKVVGGFSKLLKAFVRANPDAEEVISFADLRWSQGDVYEKNGFDRITVLPPCYSFVRQGKRIRKQAVKRDTIIGWFGVSSYDDNLSIARNAEANGVYRIYDCGLIKYLMKLK